MLSDIRSAVSDVDKDRPCAQTINKTGMTKHIQLHLSYKTPCSRVRRREVVKGNIQKRSVHRKQK